MNLCGVIVPIVDLRIKFGMSDVKYNDLTVTIVLNIGSRVIGMVVDSVSDVIELQPKDTQMDHARQENAAFGIGRRDGRRRIQLAGRGRGFGTHGGGVPAQC